MSNETLMDPQDFAERLEGGFGFEPPHAPVADDLGRGRRRLLRRRVGTSVAALATVGVVGAGSSLVPGLFAPDAAQEVGPAASPTISAAEIVATCMRKENVLHVRDGNYLDEAASLALMGHHPTLTSSAVVANRTQATLLSADGKFWGKCQFRNAPDNGVKNAMGVYSTDVTFPRTKVDGVRAYEPVDETDPRLVANVDPPLPLFETPCVLVTEDATQFAAAQAKCPEFTMHWTDRRPVEVAAVRVTTPDGVESWADVDHGYLSFAYTGTMTPEIAAQVTAGETPAARRVVFYDEDGNVLVDDRHPGQLPRDGSLSMANFPSLAWWLT